jgi:hypothetical protein
MKTATFSADVYRFLKPGHPSSPHETETANTPAVPGFATSLGRRLVIAGCNFTGISVYRQAVKLRERFW